MTPSETQTAFRLRSLIATVYVPSFLNGAGLGMVIPVIPLFAKELGAGLALVGVVVAARGIGAMAFDLPGGVLVSRLGTKRTMTLGLATATVVALGIGLAPNVGLLIALMLVNGVAWALWSLARLAYMTHVVPNNYRGRAISRVGGVMRIGTFAGPIVGGFLGKHLGLEAAFFGQAVITIGALLLVATQVGDEGEAPATDDRQAHVRLRETLHAHRRSFLTAGTAALTLVLVRHGREVLIPLWGDSVGLDVAQIGLIFGIASAIDMSLFYPVGVVMDRLGRKWAVVPTLSVLSLSLAMIPLTHGFGGLLAVGILSGFGNGLGSGAVMTLGADLAPAQSTGEFLGVWRFITDSGSVAAPVTIGLLAQVLTLGTAAIATAGLGAVGAGVMLFLVRETLEQRIPAPGAGDARSRWGPTA